ncbi:hypothetical protein EVAR_26055_1 [Eumeta japonica]|uniref:Nucleic-acid-binding protein from transposon X-element n=1 Tax=Eumeta variegata TaxID=151549 RepID=A0A4C1VT34_EUMVA|nr:hypothetical protein EVAR_26055_1 [Eumeta japonica]
MQLHAASNPTVLSTTRYFSFCPYPRRQNVYKIKSVYQIDGIKVEALHKREKPLQCHNCQLYSHAAKNCTARPRCQKCLGDHAIMQYSYSKNATDPLRCVLCSELGYPASYRGRSTAPKSNRIDEHAENHITKSAEPVRNRPTSSHPRPPESATIKAALAIVPVPTRAYGGCPTCADRST